jgi:hypothetical protein
MFFIIATLANAQVPAYGPCNPTNHRYQSVQGQRFPITPALSNSPITVSGQVTIIDGCKFSVQNFVFFNARESYWYGANKGTADGITLSDTVVIPSAFPANFTFDLTQRVGAQANFNGLNQLRLFERDSNVVVAMVDLPEIAAPAPGSIPGSGSPTASGAPGSTKTNGAVEKSLVGTVLGFLTLLL